jgi:hypothetical protein
MKALTTLVVVSLISLSIVGCKPRKPVTRHVQVDGTIKNIDINKKRVEMSYFHPKENRQKTDAGFIDHETEIMIDGRIASLEDVRVGDYAVVTGFITGDEPFVAEKVAIDRKGLGAEQSPAPKASQDS